MASTGRPGSSGVGRPGVYVLPAGAGKALWIRGNRFTFKAHPDDVGGAFSVVETTLHKGAEAPAHRHRATDEALYVIDGTMRLEVDGETLVAPAGSFGFLPRGTKHRYLVDGDVARVLWFISPAGFEHFWLEIGTPVEMSPESPPPSAPDPVQMAEFGRKYDTEFFRPGE